MGSANMAGSPSSSSRNSFSAMPRDANADRISGRRRCSVSVGLRQGQPGRGGQQLQGDVHDEDRLLQQPGGLLDQVLPAPSADDHAQQAAVDGLRLLELRGLAVDDDLGGVLHEPGPAKALRHLDDGELALRRPAR